MSEGILLLGHGSRREEANEEIREIARMVAGNQTGAYYETAFLSAARPTIPEAVDKLAKLGVDSIIVAPVLLLTGNHIAQDIPEEIEKQRAKYPDIQFFITGHLGTHPAVAEIVKERIQAVLQPK